MYFFWHKDAPDNIRDELKGVLIQMIENNQVDLFYIGNHGNFDVMTREVLKELKIIYPHIKYFVVLSYMPYDKNQDYSDTIFPEGLENALPKYAIIKRNQWMLERADYVVVYVRHTFGGAYKFKEMAEKKKKTVINIALKDFV